MKTITITINRELRNIPVTVKNGRKFQEDLNLGNYEVHEIKLNETDALKVKRFMVKAHSFRSCRQPFKYGYLMQCNGHDFGLVYRKKKDGSETFTINTFYANR